MFTLSIFKEKMRFSIPILMLFGIVLIGCKQHKKEEVPAKVEQSIMEKIAHANGFEHWKYVKELKFTFNVDRDSSHFERSWNWNISKNEVTMMSANDTMTYKRSQIDSTNDKANSGFINDKFWLLAPFNLVWDKDNYTFEHNEAQVAPISGKNMQKLTIVYGSEGGYTPGDAYDFYFEGDYMLKEWAFRKANQPEVSLATTWEAYLNLEGVKIAQNHVNETGTRWYFTGIELKSKKP